MCQAIVWTECKQQQPCAQQHHGSDNHPSLCHAAPTQPVPRSKKQRHQHDKLQNHRHIPQVIACAAINHAPRYAAQRHRLFRIPQIHRCPYRIGQHQLPHALCQIWHIARRFPVYIKQRRAKQHHKQRHSKTKQLKRSGNDHLFARANVIPACIRPQYMLCRHRRKCGGAQHIP